MRDGDDYFLGPATKKAIKIKNIVGKDRGFAPNIILIIFSMSPFHMSKLPTYQKLTQMSDIIIEHCCGVKSDIQ